MGQCDDIFSLPMTSPMCLEYSEVESLPLGGIVQVGNSGQR